MADKSNSSNGAGAAPAVDDPAAVRNVVLVGPSGGGKTTLVDALLVASGVLSRPGCIADGTTVCDHDEAEIRQQRSVSLALASLSHDGVKVNLVDTPGYADFVGELRAGLRAADCALFVIAANEDVDEPTKSLWQECSQVGMPRAVVITKLDHARANYQNALAAAQNAFGDKVLPLYLPTGDGVIGLLSQTHYEYAKGKRTTHAPDASYADQIEEARGTLIEGIIEESEDESLMERYLGGEKIDEAVLIDDLEKAVARGSFFPVIPVCSSTGVGTLELLEIATRGFPSPREHPLPEVFTAQGAAFTKVTCGSDSPLLAEVVKTTSDPYVGRLSLVRVFSGTIRPDTTVHVSGHFSSFFGSPDGAGPDSLAGHVDHDEDERIGALSFPLGKQQRPASMVLPGDMCAIGRLSRAETGDTLSDKAQPLVLKPWMMPESLLPVAIQAHAKTDEDKLSVGLGRLAAEDPTLRIEQNPETHQIVLWCMGEAHAGVVLDALANRYGVTRGYRRAAGTAARNLWQQGERPRPARQTVRWTRSVRGVRHRGRTATRRLRVRVRRQGGRRRGAAPVHPERREGRARSDGKGCARRLSRRRHPGHPARRQGAQRGLLRFRLPDGRRAGAERSRGRGEGGAARADRRGLGADTRRPRRRRDERLVRASRPGVGDRHRRQRPHIGEIRSATG